MNKLFILCPHTNLHYCNKTARGYQAKTEYYFFKGLIDDKLTNFTVNIIQENVIKIVAESLFPAPTLFPGSELLAVPLFFGIIKIELILS